MNASRGMPSGLFVSLPIALLLSNCALAAIDTAWLAWSYLPYERLDSFSPEERFLAWESVVWLLALALGLLGLACVLQVVGLRVREGVKKLERQTADSESRLFSVTTVLPWWMIGYAAFLVIIASGARALVAP